ncbi:CoB--CoM heterodisulfide reductase iron-sulfur subunit A family protein [candidate division FCPU426 bacterium]|nr:CoB--CoM heterodisulfide reductase iron-sulfur subunit A family protein [candidate division FCPU426 bacterium]
MAKKDTLLVLCECGNNIRDKIDLEAVRAWALGDSRISQVVSHELLCSSAGKVFFTAALKKFKLRHIIIAACSPRAHENTFRSLGVKAGVNLADVNLANIREQAAWVTANKEIATQKAITLIKAALARTEYHEKLELRSMECLTDVVVIGGGIAGMEAALLSSQAGRKVTIIEKNIALGGRVIHSEELAPNMECAPCLLSPRLFKIKDDPNIRVVSFAEAVEVVGFFGNYQVTAQKKARYVKESCIGCEACFEVCPVSVKSDFHLGLGSRKAIYTLFPGSIPAGAVIDRENCLHFKDGSCAACVSACPFAAIDFSEQDETLSFSAGAVILAIGSETHAPIQNRRLGLGLLDNVYTLAEFERLANSNGPTQGRILLKNGSPPSAVAVIHCAGSLSAEGLPFCSGTCCVMALKAGEFIRKQIPAAAVYNIHDRLVFPGPEMQSFFDKQVAHGTRLLKTPDLPSLTVAADQGQLLVTGKNLQPLRVDMVLLATGQQPAADSGKLADLLGIERSDSGFFKSDHYFLRTTGSTLDGIYAAGSCLGPVFADQAVLQAQSAAGEAVSRLVPGRQIELESMTTEIDPELCGGCKLCVSVCPYKAVSFLADQGVCAVNEAICRGCGTCAANCPSGAAQAKHFTREQIDAELEGILDD